MIKYSCTNARLVNWVLRQVNDQPGLIFPQKKGWRAYLKLVYPGDQHQAHYLVLVTNQSELVGFVPLNNKSEQGHIRCVTNHKLIASIKSELGIQFHSHQLIFLTCEKYQEYVAQLLKSNAPECSLMMLDYEKMSFVSGNFKNPRLEYRLSSQNFDTDLIPNFLPETQQTGTDSISNALFYQHLFYNLNAFWLNGTESIPLRTVLKSSIPHWPHFRKKDQQEIIDLVGNNLTRIFTRFEFEGFGIEPAGKKTESIPTLRICFPAKPVGKKELNNWLRKLELALEFFRGEANQISIDTLVFET